MSLDQDLLVPELIMLGYAQEAYHKCDIQVNDTYVIVREYNDTKIIAFRGTVISHLEDIETDMDASSEMDRLVGKTHRGFLQDARSIIIDLLPVLNNHAVALTGHSKGAAEASIFAALIKASGFPVLQLTTFGLPRIGSLNNLLVDVIGHDFVNGKDAITMIPEGGTTPRVDTHFGKAAYDFPNLTDHEIASYKKTLEDLV